MKNTCRLELALKDEYGNIIDLVEWEKQIKAEVIDDFTIKLENAIQEDIDDDVINQWDKGTFMGCVKFVAEQLKENK